MTVENVNSESFSISEVLRYLAEALSQTVPAELSDLDPHVIQASLRQAADIVHHYLERVALETDLDSYDESIAELNPDRILVVDDVKENLFLVEYMFKQTDLTVSLATSAAEALEKARMERPILVIADVEMPGMSGFDLLDVLKADDRTRNIAVIFVTAYHRSSKQVIEGLRRGADDYIYRPYVRDEFMSRVEAVLRTKRAEVTKHKQARLLARRSQGLARVNELAEAVNSAQDADSLVNAGALHLARLFNVEAAALLWFDATNEHLRLHLSTPDALTAETILDTSTLALDKREDLLAQTPRLITDVLNRVPDSFPLSAVLTPETIQTAPLQANDNLLGVVAMILRRSASLDESDWALLTSAAGIIAVALENQRLLHAARQLADSLMTLNEVSRALTSTLDLEQVLKQTTTLVNQSVQSDAMSLWLLDETGQELEMTAASGVGADTLIGYRLPIQVGIAGYVARTGEPYISGDVAQDERHFSQVASSVGFQPRSLVCVPVETRGKIVGVVQVLHGQPNRFTRDDLRLLYPLARAIGIAVENARLFEQIQEFNRRLNQRVEERTKDEVDQG